MQHVYKSLTNNSEDQLVGGRAYRDLIQQRYSISLHPKSSAVTVRSAEKLNEMGLIEKTCKTEIISQDCFQSFYLSLL